MTIANVSSEMPIAATGGTTAAQSGGIDALRACLTLLVVLHHTAITYGGAGGWFYRELLPTDTHSSRLLTLFCAVNQAYFMGLFFLIAGYFTPAAVERHGVAAFVRDRLIRLGVPLLVFAVLIGPATVALVQAVTRHRDFIGVLLQRWFRRWDCVSQRAPCRQRYDPAVRREGGWSCPTVLLPPTPRRSRDALPNSRGC